MKIKWPKGGQVMNVLHEYSRVVDPDEDVEILFEPKVWIEPASLSALTCEILQFPERKHSFSGDGNVLNYLSRMNFFKSVGFDYNEKFSRNPDAGRIIPLQPVADSNQVHRAVTSICDMVTRHLPNAREFVPAMEWAVNEIVDNITIHSETITPGMVCAQFYPDRDWIALGIADSGRGIRSSLSESYSFSSDFEAISKAVERGVTRNQDVGQGNGLAGSVQIAELNKGEIDIFSGRGLFRQYPGTVSRQKIETIVRGTVIFLGLSTRNPVNLLNTFMAESATGWHYFDQEAQLAVENGGLVVKEQVVHCRGRDQGKSLRNKVRCLVESLGDNERLKLDFKGVVNPSSSFLDELLGRLVVEMGADVFKKKIEVIIDDPTVLMLARTVTKQRMQQVARG